MIDKTEAERLGVGAVGAGERSAAERGERLERLRALLQGVVGGDGQVDVGALRDAVGGRRIAAGGQGY